MRKANGKIKAFVFLGVVFLLIVAVAALTFKHWEPIFAPIVVVGLIIISQMKKPDTPSTTLTKSIADGIIQNMFIVIDELTRRRDILPMILAPIDIEDIRVSPQIVIENNLQIVRVRVMKNRSCPITDDDTKILKSVLQERIKARRSKEMVEGNPLALYNKMRIQDVRCEGMYYLINVAYVMSEYVEKKRII